MLTKFTLPVIPQGDPSKITGFGDDLKLFPKRVIYPTGDATELKRQYLQRLHGGGWYDDLKGWINRQGYKLLRYHPLFAMLPDIGGRKYGGRYDPLQPANGQEEDPEEPPNGQEPEPESDEEEEEDLNEIAQEIIQLMRRFRDPPQQIQYFIQRVTNGLVTVPQLLQMRHQLRQRLHE